jgi:hypothetical protein
LVKGNETTTAEQHRECKRHFQKCREGKKDGISTVQPYNATLSRLRPSSPTERAKELTEVRRRTEPSEKDTAMPRPVGEKAIDLTAPSLCEREMVRIVTREERGFGTAPEDRRLMVFSAAGEAEAMAVAVLK